MNTKTKYQTPVAAKTLKESDYCMTLRECAAELGCCVETVRVLEKSAILKIRKMLGISVSIKNG